MSTAKSYLPCGHPIGCLYSFKIGDETRRYCFGCVIDKSGLKPFTDLELQQCTNVSKLEKSKEVKKVKEIIKDVKVNEKI